MSSNSSLANERLLDASRAKDQVKRWTWLLVIAAVAVFSLISFAAADYWLLLPLNLRYGAFAVLVLVALLGIMGLRRFFRKPTSLKEAALDAERQRAEPDCVVSTAAEYIAGKASDTNEYEPQLAAALQDEAGRRLERVELPYRRTLWIPALVFSSAVLGLGIFLVLTPSSSTAVKRVTLPWLNAHYTEVQVTPGDAEVRSGTDVEIASTFTGRSPKAPRIEWQKGDNLGWEMAELSESAPMKFAFPLKNVTNSIRYRVLGGDAVSPEFQLTPYVPPELKHFSVNVASPEYTKLKPSVQQSTNFTILRGSTATVHVRANVDLSRARIRFADTNAPALDLRAGENGLWGGSFSVRTNTDYFVELYDAKGRQGGNEKPFRIATKGDEPPRVEILEPGQDMRADSTNKVLVKISAADDFGVGEVKLVFHKLREPEKSVIAQAQSEKNGELIATAEIDLAPLNLQTNELVAYYAEARDNNNLDGPGVGKSQVFFIEITNKESSGTPPPLQPLPNERVNLLTVQKQIIADTVALKKDSSTNDFGDLALRQKDATDFAKIHLESLKIAPAEAITEMQSAIAAMEKASAELEKSRQAGALPPEEDALARLYRVLALMPQLQMTNVAMRPPTNMQQRLPPPQLNVVMQEIRKRKPPEERQDPEIVAALETAEQLSDLQAQLNEAEQQLALAQVKDRPQPDEEGQPSDQQNNQQQRPQNNQQAQGRGQGRGRGQGAGQGQGERQGQGRGQPGQPQNGEAQTPGEQKQNSQQPPPSATQLAQTQTQKSEASNPSDKPAQEQPEKAPEEKPEAKPPETQLAKQQNPQSAAKPQSGQGRRGNPNATARNGNANGAGRGQPATATRPPGRGRGTGTQPGSGQGQGGQQLGAQQPDMAQAKPQKNEDEPRAEQLAEKQEQLSKEAQALAEKLERLAGKGTRVGHNVAASANKAAEEMKGAAEALKQGNAAGAGRRGTESSQQLDKVVTALQRALAVRPDLIDVSAEEAPKEYEGLISEYFRKLSYEK